MSTRDADSDGLCATVDDEETRLIAAMVLARMAGAAVPEPELEIGRYIKAEPRANGGMGRVFVAFDPGLGRKVALKALPVGLQPHEPAAAVSRREGMALAGLDHPNVVRVYEVIQHHGLDCLVLEHIDGVDLGDWLRAAPRDPREVLRKFILAGDGLAAVHGAGLVHRDFKPANVVVDDERGKVKLIDFGLAAAARPAGSPEPDELAGLGTPRYMSPEQIRGVDVDARSDQFSFCVALYEALLGVHPFVPPASEVSLEEGADTIASQAAVASRRAVFADIRHGQLRAPASVPPEVPRHVVAALERGLQLDPARRFPTMDALLSRLRWDPGRTRRRVLTGVGAAFLLGLAVGVTAHVFRPEVCPTDAATAARLWNGRRAQVEANLAFLGEASLAALDRRAQDLAAARGERCAARVRGDRDDLDAAKDMCLEAREAEFSEVAEALLRGDRRVAQEVTARLADLPDAASCQDSARLRYACPSPVSVELTRGTAALLGRDFVAARAAAEAVLRAPELAQSDSLAIQADVLLGRVWYDQGDYPQARAALERGVARAELKKCFGVALEGYHWLTKIGALDAGVPLERAKSWLELYGWRVGDGDGASAADVFNNAGLFELRRGSLAEAERLLRAAIARRTPTLDDTVAQADSYLNLASVLSQSKRPDEAKQALDAAQVRRAAALGPRHPLLYKELLNGGNRAVERGQLAAAGPLYERALAQATAGLGPDAPILGEIQLARMRVFDRLGDRNAALDAALAADRAYAKLPDDDLRRSEAQEAVAQAYIAEERFAEAEPWLTRAEAQLQVHPEVTPRRRGVLEFRWAEVRNGRGDPTDGERRARAALQWFDEAGLAADHEDRAHASLLLAEALLAQGRWREAVPGFEFAERVWKKTGSNQELLAYAQWGLAQSLCHAIERRFEAERAADDAIANFEVIDPAKVGHISGWRDTVLRARRPGNDACRSSI